MKRKVLIGTAFLALLGALLVAQGVLGRGGDRPGAGQAAGAAVRGRSVLAEAAAESLAARQRRSASASTRRTTSGSSTAARPTLNNENAASSSRSAECCQAAPPVLVFDKSGQRRPQLGRAGPGLRLAGVEPRHLRRSHRQRLDRRQRPGRLAHREVHAGRQVRRAVRQARTCGRRGKNAQGDPTLRREQQRPGQLRPRREDHRRSESQRGLHRRRLLESPRRRARRGDRQDEAVLGRVRREAATTRPSARTIRPRRRPSSSATRCTARICPTTACSTSATASTTASRCSNRTARSSAR